MFLIKPKPDTTTEYITVTITDTLYLTRVDTLTKYQRQFITDSLIHYRWLVPDTDTIRDTIIQLQNTEMKKTNQTFIYNTDSIFIRSNVSAWATQNPLLLDINSVYIDSISITQNQTSLPRRCPRILVGPTIGIGISIDGKVMPMVGVGVGLTNKK
jgi:hypothetical protein